MSWQQVTYAEVQEGDIIRAYRGVFDRIQGTVTKDEEGDLYVPWVGYITNQYRNKYEGEAVEKWSRFERKV